MTRIRITEYIDLEVEDERWRCRVCDAELGPARSSYREHLRLHERDPLEVHRARLDGELSFAPDPAWVRIVEFYCPGCSTQVDTEYLPPGHPITHDIEIDVDRLKERLASGELRVQDERLVAA
jgi:acetone carboxylase, gamma subunit